MKYLINITVQVAEALDEKRAIAKAVGFITELAAVGELIGEYDTCEARLKLGATITKI